MTPTPSSPSAADALPKLPPPSAMLADALDVLRMVDDNHRVDEGEKRKAWNGRFVIAEVRRVLGAAK